MPFKLSDADFEQVATALAAPAVKDGSIIRYELSDAESGRRLILEIHPGVVLPSELADQPSGLISAYGMNAFLQLQGVTGLIVSEELGEVIFFARRGGTTDGLVIERGAGCSLYSNVDDRLLAADFTRLPAEIMMSAVALSMSETLFGDLP